MATTAKRVKDARKPKFSSRKHNRCQICGRPRAFLRKFGVCRLCFRGLALRGEIPGVSKSSWYPRLGRMNGLAASCREVHTTSPQVLRPAYKGRSKRAT
jgi:small subunit ribosomal protein S14